MTLMATPSAPPLSSREPSTPSQGANLLACSCSLLHCSRLKTLARHPSASIPTRPVSLAASSKFYKLVEPALPDVVHAAIGLMQIPPESEAQWECDLAQYLQDEDPDSFGMHRRCNPRTSHMPLLLARCLPHAPRYRALCTDESDV